LSRVPRALTGGPRRFGRATLRLPVHRRWTSEACRPRTDKSSAWQGSGHPPQGGWDAAREAQSPVSQGQRHRRL